MMRDIVAYVTEAIAESEDDPRGVPDCYVVAHGETREPIAIFKTKQALLKNVHNIAKKHGDITGATWWFDDEEKF